MLAEYCAKSKYHFLILQAEALQEHPFSEGLSKKHDCLPEGLLRVPLVAGEEATSAHASIIVTLFEIDLGILDGREGDADDHHGASIFICEVQALRHLPLQKFCHNQNLL